LSVLGGEQIDRTPWRGITIGQLADYAGVTIKAVRHYHKRGLLEEPERDASGYRRYSVRHAIDLVKIKTLAEAGVPLARIKELLAADPEHFGGSGPLSVLGWLVVG
jgi:DNA-binding transcriptional MerR regulator